MSVNDVQYRHKLFGIDDAILFTVSLNISTTWPMGKVFPSYRGSGIFGLQQASKSHVTDFSFSSFMADNHTYYFVVEDVSITVKTSIFTKPDAVLQIVYKENLYDSYSVVYDIGNAELLADLCKSGSLLLIGICI